MKRLIFIIEDELLIAHDIRQILEQEGYEVMLNIMTVEKAVSLIEIHKPDLVLIDINLNQQMDGIKIGQYLNNADNIPYVYITSYTDKLTLDEVKDTRPHGFIAKPFKPVDIVTTVSIVLSNYAHRAVEPVRDDTPVVNDAPFRIKNAINYINENIGSRIEISEVAACTKWKTEHFIRIFTKHTGITPYQYILRRKIEKAMAYLEETTLSSGDIAFELGFESYGNFNIAFKKATGMTADAYRKVKKTGRS